MANGMITGAGEKMSAIYLTLDTDPSFELWSSYAHDLSCNWHRNEAGKQGNSLCRNYDKRDYWVTVTQVFEYFVSHHLGKTFESVFGGVSRNMFTRMLLMFLLKARKTTARLLRCTFVYSEKTASDDHWGPQIGGYNENHTQFPAPPVALCAWSGWE
ncbi:uncharacterized protein EDB91DRAFT_1335310 [Suillus paluster]|uniref:uncharacterized protein n=1 Tax=Suillus paluster TaxID=48578 RepID=UPI001B87A96A|nr:uncharacterized protein EDB91DRAFT_1335310 [Suillus paluster]KAG1745368.1 hypothetical protein EDB91DRAFT_1335310 [Suillus paluster]